MQPGALFTDLYQLNMASSYLRRGMTDRATFSLFVRTLPRDRGFLVAAGVGDCLDYLEDLRFDDAELSYLSEVVGFDDATVEGFGALRFTGDVRAVPEGRVVLPDEPLLEVAAPIGEAQLVETFLLNRITFQTAIATKAARCVIAAGDADCVDFAARRTHGIDAAFAVARLTAIAGFAATSNVAAAQRYGLTPSGTMAHSYIEAFTSEREAFLAFAADVSGPVTFLVDTYDTPRGVETAIEVIERLGLSGRLAVRLDSGDILALSKQARHTLDDAGHPEVGIFASGGLDEHQIEELMAGGAPIDGFGIGTQLGVSGDAPSLDSAYKLVDYAGRPVLKLSPAKETLPGAKQVFRRLDGGADVIACADEPVPDGSEPLLVEMMRDGRRVGPPDTLDAARARCRADLAALPAEARKLRDPHPPPVRLSAALEQLRDEMTAAARR